MNCVTMDFFSLFSITAAYGFVMAFLFCLEIPICDIVFQANKFEK